MASGIGSSCFLARARANQINLESELLTVVNLLSLEQLCKLIESRNGCENDAKTIKSVASFLFFSVVNTKYLSGRTPKQFAHFTERIWQSLPETLRDWSSPTTEGGPPNQGKELFRYLIQRNAHAYLESENTTIIKPSGEALVYSNIDDAATIDSLKDESKSVLAEFIGELVLRNMLPCATVRSYCLKLLHSLYHPTPSASELEALCRLVCITAPILQSEQWRFGIFNAMNRLRTEAPEAYEVPVRTLLLVKSPRIYKTNGSRKQFGWLSKISLNRISCNNSVTYQLLEAARADTGCSTPFPSSQLRPWETLRQPRQNARAVAQLGQPSRKAQSVRRRRKVPKIRQVSIPKLLRLIDSNKARKAADVRTCADGFQ
jgi:hypothetical protein